MEYLSQIPSNKETKGVESFPFTPDRLTHVLRKNRCITSSQVITIAAQRIGAEFGFLDSLLRLTLTYDQPEPSAPQSLVMKLLEIPLASALVLLVLIHFIGDKVVLIEG